MTSDRVKQVKEANDIVEVIGGYVALRPAGPTFKGLCPFHDDHRPSFDVDPRYQRYRCWSCGEYGDVLTFVQKHERVTFPEALRILATRAGIQLDDDHPRQAREDDKARLREAVSWAAEQYHQCYLDSELATHARHYVGERKLLGQTTRKFGVGYAPLSGDWLVRLAEDSGISHELLEKVGLIAKRTNGPGYYDRFRDRVLFPIRDAMGRPVGFGGRVLPNTPLASRGPKYYNSPATPLFSKSDQLFGLDLARTPAAKEGYLAVVEGYTDVMMAHQCGVGHVVATLGTALNERHVQHLRRFVPRVVLVFDADAGGNTGVDRALEIFASQEMDLAIAALPAGLDPCDLLSQPDGAERFKGVLAGAADALDFKLERLLAAEQSQGVEGQRRAVEAVLGVIALAPELPGQAGAVKRELIVSRIARRLALKEETLWARLEELKEKRRKVEERDERPAATADAEAAAGERKARPAAEEAQLLQILLAEPGLVEKALPVVSPEEVGHPGLRKMLAALYDLHRQGLAVSIDRLRVEIDDPRLAEWVVRYHDIGRANNDRAGFLAKVLAVFRDRQAAVEKRELHNQLHAAQDHGSALELLRQLQNQ